jgi:hypothetical protein
MEEPSLEALRDELAQLEAREAMLSAQRRHLHNPRSQRALPALNL